MLRINDPKINRDFELSRNKDIVIVSLICLVIRTLSLISAAITIHVSPAISSSYQKDYWITRSVGIATQAVLLLICYKKPLKLLKFYSGLLMLTLIMNYAYLIGRTLNQGQIASSISAFYFFLIMCIMLNNCWIITSIGMLTSLVTTIIFYQTSFDIKEIPIYVVLASTTLLSIYSCYFIEKRLKL